MNGKVITGYSKPYVAEYHNNEGVITYTNGMALARGVSVSIDVDSSDVTDFFADNIVAESAGGTFTSGTVTLTVDGLKEEARALIMGLPSPSTISVGGKSVNVYDYDDRQAKPYLGVGFVVRYMEGGETTYAPLVLTKTVFSEEGLDAATQEEDIEFQTTDLEATIMRDDSEHHMWKRLAEDQTSEADAEAVIKTILNIQSSI